MAISWPSLTWSQVVSQASSVEAFASEVQAARKRWLERPFKQPTLLPEMLGEEKLCGVECSKEYMVLTKAEIDERFQVQSQKLQLPLPWLDFTDELGRSQKGLAFETDKPRTLKFTSASTMKIGTQIGGPESLLRQGQHSELHSHLVSQKHNRDFPQFKPMTLTEFAAEMEKMKSDAATRTQAAPAAPPPPLAAAAVVQEQEKEIDHVQANAMVLGMQHWASSPGKSKGKKGEGRGGQGRGAGRGKLAGRGSAADTASRSRSGGASSAAPREPSRGTSVADDSASQRSFGTAATGSPTKKRRVASGAQPTAEVGSLAEESHGLLEPRLSFDRQCSEGLLVVEEKADKMVESKLSSKKRKVQRFLSASKNSWGRSRKEQRKYVLWLSCATSNGGTCGIFSSANVRDRCTIAIVGWSPILTRQAKAISNYGHKGL